MELAAECRPFMELTTLKLLTRDLVLRLLTAQLEFGNAGTDVKHVVVNILLSMVQLGV